MYSSSSVTITLSDEAKNKISIGDELEILFTNLSDGDVTGQFGWESKVIRLVITNNPASYTSGTFDIWDVYISDSKIATGKMGAEYKNGALNVKLTYSSKSFSSSAGGGAVSEGVITAVRLIHRIS